jgi:hypothetical protein
MAEEVLKVGVVRVHGFLYYVDKNGDVSRAKMAAGGKKGSKPEKVAKCGIKKEAGYLYFLNKNGDIARAKMVNPSEEYPGQSEEVDQPEDEFVALGVFGNKIKVVTLTSDGEYRFLDKASILHSILYVASSATQALERAVAELEALVNDNKNNEADFQKFFERHPEFILTEDHKKAHPHITLAGPDTKGEMIPDFVLEPINQGSFCDLLELKLPQAQVFVLKKGRARFSAAVTEAAAQLREYGKFFDEEKNRAAIQASFGLLAYKPRMFVVIGRRGRVNPFITRDSESDLPNISLRTYDDLIERVQHRIKLMRSGKR